MNGFTGFVVFAIIWWTVLFAVLPFGVRPDAGADAETGWRGVPTRPRMWRKFAITTGIAVVLWGAVFVTIRSGLISFREGYFSAAPD